MLQHPLTNLAGASEAKDASDRVIEPQDIEIIGFHWWWEKQVSYEFQDKYLPGEKAVKPNNAAS